MNRLPRRPAAAVALAAVIVAVALAPLRAAATPPVRLAAAAGPAGAGGEDKPVALTIAFTGDVSGYLEPCG